MITIKCTKCETNIITLHITDEDLLDLSDVLCQACDPLVDDYQLDDDIDKWDQQDDLDAFLEGMY